MLKIDDHTFIIAKERDIRVSEELFAIVSQYQYCRLKIHKLMQDGLRAECKEIIDEMDLLSEKAQQIICSPFN